MIRFSYFGNRKLQVTSKCIAIANTSIPNQLIRHRPNLAPRWGDVHAYKQGYMSFSELERRYTLMVLDKLDPKSFLEMYDGCTLLCWEKDIGTCHRLFLLKWLRRNNIESEEIGLTREDEVALGIPEIEKR